MRPSQLALAALALGALGLGTVAGSHRALAFDVQTLDVGKGSQAQQLADPDESDELRLNKPNLRFESEGSRSGRSTLFQSENGKFYLGITGGTDISGRSDPWSVGGPGMPGPMFLRR